MKFHVKTLSALPALLVGAGLAGTTFAAQSDVLGVSVTAGVKQSDNRDLIDEGKKEDQLTWYVAPTIRIRKEIADLLQFGASYSPVYTHYEDVLPGNEKDKWEHTVRADLAYMLSPLTLLKVKENYWWSGQKDYFYGDEYDYDPTRDDRLDNDYYQNRLNVSVKQELTEGGDYVKVGGRWRIKRYDDDERAATNDEDEYGARVEYMHVYSETFACGVFADYTSWDRESASDVDLGVDYLTVGVQAQLDVSGDGDHLLYGEAGWTHVWYEADDLDDQDSPAVKAELRLFQQQDTQLFAGVRYGRDFSNVYPFSSQEDLAGYASIRQYFGEDRRFSANASVELRKRTYDAKDDVDPAAAGAYSGDYDRDSVYVRLNAKYAVTDWLSVGAFYTYEDIDSDVGASYKENVFGANGTVTLF